jgi:3-deoxy-D-manno-octulosonic acid (KDO) 8-phosphate synthase
MEVRFDNELVKTVIMEANEEFNDNIFIDSKKCSHGYHTVQVDLYPMINNITGKPVTPIVFEVAVVENEQTTPIVWLGNY